LWQTLQGIDGIAIGRSSGASGQGNYTVAIGAGAGFRAQGANSVAVGVQAGEAGQGANCIAIGASAGLLNQGQNAVAIGRLAGDNNQSANSIVINASNTSVNPGAAGFFVNPIRASSVSGYILMKDVSSDEIVRSTALSLSGKTFVIQHPVQEEKYLVHACVESPNTELIYRGTGILFNKECTIRLPDYAPLIGYNWSIELQSIGRTYIQLTTTEVTGQEFTVYGNIDGKFYWHVYGQRTVFEVEPLKSSTNIKGDGPYKWVA
jgi:hypothetical protein